MSGQSGVSKPSVSDLLASLNDTADTSRNVLTALLGIVLLLAATILASSDQAILRDALDAPFGINAQLRLSIAYILMPPIFLFIHAHALLQLKILQSRLQLFLKLIRSAGSKDWRQCISGFALLQYWAQEDPTSLSGKINYLLLGLISFCAIAVVPFALLLATELSFLRYQSPDATLSHQIILTIDGLLILYFYLSRDAKQKRRSTLPSLALLFVVGLPVLLVWWQANPPAGDVAACQVRWLPNDGYKNAQVWRKAVESKPAAPLASIKGSENVGFREYIDVDLLPLLGFGFLHCPTRIAYTSGGTTYSLQDGFRLADDVKRANLLDRFVCPQWGWGCRYLRLSDLILLREGDGPSLDEMRGADEYMTSAERNEAGSRSIGIDLSNRSLLYADLHLSRLYGADLRNSDLRFASLYRAHLDRAVLSNSELGGANLTDASLHRAQLTNVHARHALFDNAQMQRSLINDSKFRGSSFVNANLQMAKILSSDFRGAVLDGTQMQGAELDSVDLWAASSVLGNFAFAHFKNVHVQGAWFAQVDFQYATGMVDRCAEAYFERNQQESTSPTPSLLSDTARSFGFGKDDALEVSQQFTENSASPLRCDDGTEIGMAMPTSPDAYAAFIADTACSSTDVPEMLATSFIRKLSNSTGQLVAAKLLAIDPATCSKITAITADMRQKLSGR
ncbi:MAG TPA: pentapeptide repeat-containing protein [Dongiaceae bacterium]